MKKNENMQNSNRMAIKLKDESKLYIDRKYVDGKLKYMVSLSNNTSLKEGTLPKNSVIVFEKMFFDERNITISSLLVENIGLKEVYFNNNGYLDTYIESYYPNPEEESFAREMTLTLDNVKEISTDLDMFKEMMDDKLIDALVEDLASFNLYYPQIYIMHRTKVKVRKHKNKD